MANIKITALPAYADPASTDVLPIVDVGADVTKKVSIQDLLENAGSGTAAAPGIAFDGDSDTGIYRPGADQVALSTGGTGRLFVDASGNVSISGETLSVNGISIGRGGGNVSTNTQVGSSALPNNTSGDFNTAIGTLALTSNTTGGSNTAIGRGAQYFNVSGPSNVAIGRDALLANVSGGSNVCIGTNAGKNVDGNANTIIGTIVGTSGLSNTVIIGAGSTERLRIDSSGRLGLGTSSPSYKLDVATIIYAANQSGGVRFGSSDQNSTRILQKITAGGIPYSEIAGSRDNNGWLAFTTGASDTERLRITASGNVGVGTTSPGATLHAVGGSTVAILQRTGTNPCQINVGDSNLSNIYYDADAHIFRAGAGTERARIDSSGRLLVGTSSAFSFVNTNPSTVTPRLQLAGLGEDASSFGLFHFTTGFVSRPSSIAFARSQNGTIGQHGIVADGAKLGEVSFHGSDGIGFIHAANIRGEVDGTPGTNDMPGRLVFSTTADGASSPTEQLRITSDRYVRLASGTGGIQFNGDTAAANALDDYEEGTWSVALTGVTGSNFVGAEYVKVGNLVHLKFSRVSTGAQTFTAGDPVEITGWPFSAAQKAGNTATTCVNVANQNASWAAVNQGIKMFNMVFEQGGNTARLYNMSTGAVVTYGDLYLNPTSTNPAIRGYVVVNVA